jgi:hypothetical protein
VPRPRIRRSFLNPLIPTPPRDCADVSPSGDFLVLRQAVRERSGRIRTPDGNAPNDHQCAIARPRFPTRTRAKIDDALAKGYITLGMKDWATSLCRQNEASFDAFLEKSGRVFALLMEPTHTSSMPPDQKTS